jgi:hypothetical protein
MTSELIRDADVKWGRNNRTWRRVVEHIMSGKNDYIIDITPTLKPKCSSEGRLNRVALTDAMYDAAHLGTVLIKFV